MSEWRWKDQDELAAAEEAGIYSKEKAQKIRQEAERAIHLVTIEQRSFYEQWRDWKPNSQWGLPRLDTRWKEKA
jgi:predicted RNA-binding protein associated with RNAse of E/G family